MSMPYDDLQTLALWSAVGNLLMAGLTYFLWTSLLASNSRAYVARERAWVLENDEDTVLEE